MIDFWTCVLALTIFLYVTLDGFDLGVGMLMPFADAEERDQLFAAISPVWDGNETWLVINATLLFGVFPLAYATLLSAFYLPLMFMLAGLVFRGVAFEFRNKSDRSRVLWERGFIAASFAASFLQGAALGALIDGLPMDGTRYVGGSFGWLSTFAVFSGVGICVGYALMGAGWVVLKAPPSLRDRAFAWMPRLLVAMVALLVGLGASLAMGDARVDRRWLDTPSLFVVPVIGVLICLLMWRAIRKRRELAPFVCAVGLFAAALAALAVSFYPWMVPFAITTTQAAAPPSSQSFLFWGAGVFVLPLTLIYTLVVYFVFKGRIGTTSRREPMA